MSYSPIEVWSNIEGIEVEISPLRRKDELLRIPNGDILAGSTEEVRSQLTRRGFFRETGDTRMSKLTKTL